MAGDRSSAEDAVGATERAALYRFLARAYLAPPDDDLLALAGEIAELAPFVGEGLADHHTWLFDFNVYPYAGVFLDPSGMLDAPWAGFVAGVYRALGFEVVSGAGLAGPDHLAALLEAVAALLEREGGAEDELAAERARHGQRTLLREHLAPWLPSFLAAVGRADSGFYAGVAALTREVVVDHIGALWAPLGEDGASAAIPAPKGAAKKGGEGAGTPGSSSVVGGGTDAPGDLPDPDYRARDSQRGVQHSDASTGSAGDGARPAATDDDPPPGLQRLLVRAQSGLFLSRADLTMLGERMTLPLRFAERRFMLEHLVRGAAEREALPELIEGLTAQAAKERAELEAWARSAPRLAGVWRQWLARLDATAAWLAEVAVDGGELAWRDVPPRGRQGSGP